MRVVAQGHLLGLTMKRALRSSQHELGLVVLRVPELEWKRSFGAITRAGGYLPPSGRRVLELLGAAWRA